MIVIKYGTDWCECTSAKRFAHDVATAPINRRVPVNAREPTTVYGPESRGAWRFTVTFSTLHRYDGVALEFFYFSIQLILVDISSSSTVHARPTQGIPSSCTVAVTEASKITHSDGTPYETVFRPRDRQVSTPVTSFSFGRNEKCIRSATESRPSWPSLVWGSGDVRYLHFGQEYGETTFRRRRYALAELLAYRKCTDVHRRHQVVSRSSKSIFLLPQKELWILKIYSKFIVQVCTNIDHLLLWSYLK
jgi:hypothetical protein